VPESRLSESMLAELRRMISVTGQAWIDAGLVRNSSFGVQLLVAERAGSDFEGALRHSFPHDV